MITVSETVEEIIKESPFLESAMSEGLLNLSALSRKIQPRIRKKLIKDVKEGAIVMALKRLKPKLSVKYSGVRHVLKNLGDITVRSNLNVYTFEKSPTLMGYLSELIKIVGLQQGKFITVTQGVYETTIIISENFKNEVSEIFRDEKLLVCIKDLSSITVELPTENVKTVGVYFTLLKVLAWNNISLVDAVSTTNEITIVFKNKDVEKAFSVLKNLKTK